MDREMHRKIKPVIRPACMFHYQDQRHETAAPSGGKRTSEDVHDGDNAVEPGVAAAVDFAHAARADGG